MADKPNLVLSEATLSDVEALAPIFSASFHPTSAYMRQAVPDTAATRKWWANVHSYAITEPAVRLLKVVDTHTNAPVSLCRWRIHDQNAIKRGDVMVETWNIIPLPQEADPELCKAFIDFQKDARAKWMTNTPHVIVELVVTADEYKGKGAGSMMIERVCEQADEKGLGCFVETNGPVVRFYQRFGFELKESVDMPGGHGYTENILVRPVNAKVERSV